MKFAICNLQFSLSAVKWVFQKIAGGDNRVKIRKRLLMGSEIRGYKTEIYPPPDHSRAKLARSTLVACLSKNP
jgi:hypothetical protein